MTDPLVALLATLPNLAIAIWCIRQYQQTIETLLLNQQKLIEQLLLEHPPADKPPGQEAPH